MTRRRVVITGLGLISPVGNTVAEGWSNLLAGRSGIAPITKFDASGITCRFAGEVKDFKVEQYIPGKEAKAMDDRGNSRAYRLHDRLWHRWSARN